MTNPTTIKRKSFVTHGNSERDFKSIACAVEQFTLLSKPEEHMQSEVAAMKLLPRPLRMSSLSRDDGVASIWLPFELFRPIMEALVMNSHPREALSLRSVCCKSPPYCANEEGASANI